MFDVKCHCWSCLCGCGLGYEFVGGGLYWALVSSTVGCAGVFGVLRVFALVCLGTRVLSLFLVPFSGSVVFSSPLGANIVSFGSERVVLPERLGLRGWYIPLTILPA